MTPCGLSPMRWLAILGLLVLLAIPAGQASTPTTLYAHIINVQDMPINTQAPYPDYTTSAAFGPMTPTLRCLDSANPGAVGLTGYDYAVAYGYASPNLVEYGMPSANGDPRVHPERGIAADVHINVTTPVVLTWYVAGPAIEFSQAQAANPAPIPDVKLRATIRAEDGISIDDRSYNSGTVLLHGESPAVTLVADQVIPGENGAEGVTAMGQRGDHWVYEFQVPLVVDVATLPAQEGFNLRIDLMMELDQCDAPDEHLMPVSVGAYTDADLRPRIDLAIVEPFVLDYADPQFIEDDAILHFGVNSVWGPYDLDLDQAELTFTGPSAEGADFVLQPFVKRYHVHGHSSFEPVQMTYVWTDGNRTMQPGHYEATLRIPNLQHTATLEARIAFDKAPANDAPAPTAPLLALGLVAVAALVRRR